MELIAHGHNGSRVDREKIQDQRSLPDGTECVYEHRNTPKLSREVPSL
jgi:hypothetical protein